MVDEPARVVVGYDGSADGERALRWAARFAKDRHLPLAVVIVASSMDPVLSDFREVSDQRAASWQVRARSILQEVETPGHVEIRHGTPTESLQAAVGNDDLLVVGSSGHRLAAGTFTGATSQHLVRRSPCPVVVVREAQDPDQQRILVGLDGSAASQVALEWAAARALESDAELVALCVRPPPAVPVPRRHFLQPAPSRPDRTASRVHAQLESLLGSMPELRLTELRVAGSAGEALSRASEHAALVVVGTRARDPLAELLLGSTAQHVLHRARCPVVVVSQTAARPRAGTGRTR